MTRAPSLLVGFKDMEKNKLTFQLKNAFSELEVLRKKLKQFEKSCKLPKKCSLDINLAMDEWITNIISHGCSDHSECFIRITLQCEKNAVTINIENSGTAFDPMNADPPDLECNCEERQIGGIGLHLMKQKMDKIEFSRCGHKNVLTMIKKY